MYGKRKQLRLQEPHLWRASPEQLLAVSGVATGAFLTLF